MSGQSERVPKGKSSKSNNRDLQKDHRKRQKEIKNLERKIALLDDDKKAIKQQLMESTDPDEALKLHTQFTDVSEQLNNAEEHWLELTEAAQTG